MKKCAAFIAFVLLMLSIHSRADANPVTPIVIELFTSEGCSSCPPVDSWLQRIDASQPTPHSQVIALSEHVDYWDHDGWKDPYSSHALTERQDAYAHILGLSSVYTPQVIVDGTMELHSRDPKVVGPALQKAAALTFVPIRITSVAVEGSAPQRVRAHIEVDGNLANQDADVFIALALDHAESKVAAGENAGKHLTHVAVVESIEKMGSFRKGKAFNRDVQLKLKPGTDGNNLRVVVFLQKSGPGPIIGAALWTSPK